MPSFSSICAASVSVVLLAACGGDFGGAGDFGATPGGVKDMSLARELIAAGQVPPPAALLVEGMFAEHDLGLVGAPCDDTLCVRAAAGVAPDRDGAVRGWIQVGLSSNVDPAQFVRPATTFIYVVDVSGSMGWGSGDDDRPTPGWLSRAVLHRLTDVLTPADQVAMVTYGSDVETPLPLISAADRARIHTAIERLGTDGSTDMESGLRRAYELGRQARAAGRTNVRLVLFTDVQPNVGATSPSSFEQMAAEGAAAGVHLTVLALGLGVGPEVLQSMAQVRGANAFGLSRSRDVAAFMADDYPWFTTPIAYDLSVAVRPSAGLTVAEPYGFPAGFDADPRLEVATVFLSKRRGALLASLAETELGALDGLAADVDLAWVDPAGVARSQPLHVARDGALDERGQWFAQAAVARTTALALLVSGMHDAAEAYGGDRDAAVAIMRGAAERFAADAAALAEPALDVEVELAEAMLALMERGAPQGTLYGP